MNERQFSHFNSMPKIASKYGKSVYDRKLVVMDKMNSRSDVDRFEKKNIKGPYDPSDKVYDVNFNYKLPKLTVTLDMDQQV